MRILKFSVIGFCVLLSFTASAQVSLGIKGGIDFGKITNAVEGNDGSGGISTQSTGTVTQFYGELFADIPLDSATKMFYFRPGIEYIGAGGEMDWTGDYYIANGFGTNTRYKLHYLDVPLEFEFSPGFSWGRPFVGIGLYAGALMNGTIRPSDSASRSAKIGNDAGDDFQKADFGYVWSIGLATKVGFQFGIDYQHGLIRIIPNDAEQAGQTKLRTHNSVWAFNVGWVFKL